MYFGGSGGGAGGSIKVVATTVNLGPTLTTATGGTGSVGYWNGNASGALNGAIGGNGRVAVYYGSSISGSSSPDYYVAQVPTNSYAVFTSDEIATPNAVSYTNISWLADETPYGTIEVQTRSGNSTNSTDGTWEAWKPASATSNYFMLDSGNASSNWVPSDTTITTSQSGVARDVDYYEDEDDSVTSDMTELTIGANANTYAEDRIAAANLSNYDFITAWLYSDTAGTSVQLGFGENSGTEQQTLVNINSANTWQKVYWDISHLPTFERDGVRYLRITAPDTNYHIYFQNIEAVRYLHSPTGANITSTPNNYFQYRIIMTSSNPAYNPVLYNIQANWNDGFKIEQTNTTTAKLYNETGATVSGLRLDAIVFGADLAEYYTVNNQSIGPGDVVAMTGQLDENSVPIIRLANAINDPQLAGVISTQAGEALGIQADNRQLLALAGRVPVKMDPASPAVHVGDFLTSSDVPGTARKARPGDITIGQALEDWVPYSGRDTMLILVKNSVDLPTVVDLKDLMITKADQLDNTTYNIMTSAGEKIENVGVFSKALIAKLQAGFIQTVDLLAENIQTSNLTVNTKIVSPLADIDALRTSLISPLPERNDVAIQIGGVGSGSAQLVVQNTSGSAVASIDTSGNATFSGTVNSQNLAVNSNASISGILYADKIKSTTLDDIQNLLHQVQQDQGLLSQASSWNVNTATNAASVDKMVISNLYVTDQAAFNALSVSTSVTVGPDLVFQSATVNGSPVNSINSLSAPLQLQSLAMAPVEIMAGKVKISTNGDVEIQGNLFVAGRVQSSGLTLSPSANPALSADNLFELKDATGSAIASINASGSAIFNSVAADKFVLAAQTATQSADVNGIITTNATAGQAIIKAGVSEITIKNPNISDYTLVYVTPTSSTMNNVLYVKSKGQGYFTVGFTNSLAVDATFNWWVIDVKQ